MPPVPYGVGATGYNKCVTVKLCFGYRKYDSVTFALLETKVPSFETVLHNARYVFRFKWTYCCNRLVSSLFHKNHLG